MSPRALSALIALHAATMALAVHTSHAGSGTKGFVFTGVGDKDWCSSASRAVTNLKELGLKCRGKSPSEPGACPVAFVGDVAATNRIESECQGLFEIVSDVDFGLCGMPERHDASFDVCIRSMSLAPFEYNIQMGMDTIALSAEVEHIFDVLQAGYDFTASLECCARHAKAGFMLADDTTMHGWEMQNGVLGYTSNEAVRNHARKAIEIFSRPSYPTDLTSGFQNAETQALSESQVHFLPLPPNFNMRSFTAVGYKDMPMALAHFKFNLTSSIPELRKEAHKLVTSFSSMFTSLFGDMHQAMPFLFRTHG
mmetsp:Transcript_23033/g.52771  ORF Transcript_23033/g.52771 Transcript_23033/m.52771 type:complete len:310 (+) Transcript_23033:40-969(+)